MPQPATGTARKSESVAQLVVPAPKGVDAGSNPARLTSHAQPRHRKVLAAVMSLPRWVGMFPALRVATDRRVRNGPARVSNCGADPADMVKDRKIEELEELFSNPTPFANFLYSAYRDWETKEIIVCEGYLDVIMLHQAGFNNAVATLGTALTKDHLPLLRRGEPRVILSYDGDKAGQNAAFKASVMLSQNGFDGGVVIFENGADPADMVKDRKIEELEELFSNPTPFANFAISYIVSSYNINNPVEKQKALSEANEYLSSLSQLYQEEYKRFLAQKLNIKESLIKTSSISNRKNSVELSKVDIAELCIIKSILDDPRRLDIVLDKIDKSMFEHHQEEFEELLNDINSSSLNKIILNDKLESYDEARLNRELLVLLHKFYSNKLLTLSYDNSMNFKEKVNQIRKVKDNLYQLKQGKLVSYNL